MRELRYFIFAIAFVVAISVLNTACNNKKANTATERPPVKDTTEIQIKTNSAYDSLRKVALSETPQTLKLTMPVNDTTVYGIVMDWETSGAIVTTVAYANGDAGSYTSAGDQMISGGRHPYVIKAAKEFVNKAQQFFAKTQKISDFPLPKKNFVIFYMLTKNGVFMRTEDMKNFDNDTPASSEWHDLFDKGNSVAAELRFLKD